MTRALVLCLLALVTGCHAVGTMRQFHPVVVLPASGPSRDEVIREAHRHPQRRYAIDWRLETW